MTEPTIVTVLRADHRAGLHDKPNQPNRHCGECTADPEWSDPDRAVQIEDDNPESLAGDEVEFHEKDDNDDDDGEGAE